MDEYTLSLEEEAQERRRRSDEANKPHMPHMVGHLREAAEIDLGRRILRYYAARDRDEDELRQLRADLLAAGEAYRLAQWLDQQHTSLDDMPF